jgi:DNA-binding MarR family transcriptional regulator
MVSDNKIRLLEIAQEEGAVTIEWGREYYSNTSNVSRAISDLVEKNLLSMKKPPTISNYRKVWVLTDKGERVLELEG